MTKPPGAVRLATCPVLLSVAIAACHRHHRHLPRVIGGLIALAVHRRGDLSRHLGWCIVGRPTSRHLDAGGWVELTRGIVPDDSPPGCASALLGAAARWADAAGQPIVTYTLGSEPGTSLWAAGWVQAGHTKGGQWDCAGRGRTIRLGDIAAPKIRWVSAKSAGYAASRGWTLTSRDGSPVEAEPMTWTSRQTRLFG